MSGIGSHQSARMKNDEWLTPPWLLEKLGQFDLDPCSPVNRPWDTANNHYTVNDNGLMLPWGGRVWCNPPYGLEASRWLQRCAIHGNAIALVFARTETDMFFRWVLEMAYSILFLKGRLTFHHVDGSKADANSGGPSCLIAYDEPNSDRLFNSGIEGKFIKLKL